MIRQTAEYTKTGTKVLPSDVADAELVPDDVTWLSVPPLDPFRALPTRGSLEFWICSSQTNPKATSKAVVVTEYI
jgi:hypothetical protein